MGRVRNYLIVFILFFMVGMVGCVSKTVTDYPEIERPIQLTEFYLDLYEQYELLYEFSGTDVRNDMKEHIAPLMNEAKEMLIDYNEIIIAGGEDREKKKLIAQKLREISYRLSEVEDESK